MAEVTDPVFRRIIAKYGKPAVLWTEFVSADGLLSAGQKRILRNLEFTEPERPIVAQLFTARPEKMLAAAKIISELGFDGLDINMGCPDRAVERQGAGAALIKNPKLAREIIAAAKQTVAGKLPVSVKTRIGYVRDELDTWLPELLAEGPAAITIHARTRAEMSKAPARWERVARAVAIRDGMESKTLIIGNGDVVNLEEAAARAAETGADGIMLGRAIIGNPFLFSNLRFDLKNPPRSNLKKVKIMIEHAKLFEAVLGDIKNFAIMRKHFKHYVSGFIGAVELRQELMDSPNATTVARAVDKYLATMIQ
ncbi:MAG: tRNA-dihydrouridine synthase [Candidatus Vogelbacteria bacterium]|nr:tRNA-dihydrouridine synthase [Candidatus Vogelbacteria bacterium]